MPESRFVSHRKPIIGLMGGIASGKSLVAGMMAEAGLCVIDADQLAREAMDEASVKKELMEWWGTSVVDEAGKINRRAVADRVFHNDAALAKLEGLIHPMVQARRAALVDQAMNDSAVPAIVYDVPLLVEIGLDRQCDYLIFIEADEAVRQARVAQRRGWSSDELKRREKKQLKLETKKKLANNVVDNSSGDVLNCLTQVQSLLKQILPSNLSY